MPGSSDWPQTRRTPDARAGIHGVSHWRKRRNRANTATYDDLVQRQFTADGPDRVQFTDITQHRTSGGWVYCCAVIDAWSRRVVGWSIADHMRNELVVDALEMTRWQRSPDGTIVHDDRGVQYTSWVAGHCMRAAGMLGSTGRVASSIDNALIEWFWSTMPRNPSTATTGPREFNWPVRSSKGLGLVQPPPAALDPGNAVTTRIRNAGHRRRKRGMIIEPKLFRSTSQLPAVRITESTFEPL